MANRSDFYSAKLPRQYKRMLAMEQTNGWLKNSHDRGRVKNLFIQAHANHVGFKLKRQAMNVDGSDGE